MDLIVHHFCSSIIKLFGTRVPFLQFVGSVWVLSVNSVMDYEDAGLVILKEGSLIFCWRRCADSISKGEMRLSWAELPLPNIPH